MPKSHNSLILDKQKGEPATDSPFTHTFLLSLDKKVASLDDGRTYNHNRRVNRRCILRAGVSHHRNPCCLEGTNNATHQCKYFLCHCLTFLIGYTPIRHNRRIGLLYSLILKKEREALHSSLPLPYFPCPVCCCITAAVSSVPAPPALGQQCQPSSQVLRQSAEW